MPSWALKILKNTSQFKMCQMYENSKQTSVSNMSWVRFIEGSTWGFGWNLVISIKLLKNSLMIYNLL